MDCHDGGSFQRKFVVYGGMKESGTLFESNRRCLKYSLPDLSGLQMQLSAERKGLKGSKSKESDPIADTPLSTGQSNIILVFVHSFKLRRYFTDVWQ